MVFFSSFSFGLDGVWLDLTISQGSGLNLFLR